MRRYRRLVLTDRIIPFLAALVGLLALAGAVLVEVNAQRRADALAEELARMRLTVELLGQRTAALADAPPPADEGAAQLAAIAARLEALEADIDSRLAAVPPAAPGDEEAETAAIDPNLPTTDCIPIGTRFMAVTGDRYPICQTPAVVRVNGISGDSVVVEGAGVIGESTSGPIAGTDCALQVFSAEAEGFAEMRVTCN